jgi:hypothetical protein
MLFVIMLFVIILFVILLFVIMHNVIMLRAIILNVIMQRVIMVNVKAPCHGMTFTSIVPVTQLAQALNVKYCSNMIGMLYLP